MTVDEMISFEIGNCITQIVEDTELRIIDGVYTISQKNELCFKEDEIKKMLLMFKPMQKELEVYKKALEMACKKLDDYEDFCIKTLTESEVCDGNCAKCIKEQFLQEAR